MPLNEEIELLTPELVVRESNTELVTKDEAKKLFAVLTPLVPRVEEYKAFADALKVRTQAEADEAGLVLARMTEDRKAVEAAVKAHKEAAQRRHKLWTTFEGFFVKNFEDAYRKAKRVVSDWQEAERQKAEAEQRRLQAEADERARKEQERLLKLAAERKTPEKQEEYREAAAAVVAPTVRVEAPRMAVKTMKVWVATVTDLKAFLSAAAIRPELAGYIEVKTTMLQRAKAANPMTDVPGITFKQETR